MHPGDRTYRNQTVRLADLTVVSDVIQDVTFENCSIIGPAVVVLQDSTLTNCVFNGTAEELFWDVGDRRSVLGVVAMVRCTIVGSSFQRIGFAGTPADIAYMRSAIGSS